MLCYRRFCFDGFGKLFSQTDDFIRLTGIINWVPSKAQAFGRVTFFGETIGKTPEVYLTAYRRTFNNRST